MASSDDERNQRNAKILQTNVFHKELIPVACFAFQAFNKKNHSDDYLHDTVEFTQILLSMLEAYSKGRVLTIQTAKTRVVRTKKAAQDDEYGDESDELPDEEATEHVERRFNFVSELAYLVDYAVIDKYVMLLKNPAHFERKPELAKATTSFFKRVVHQAKQTWIFYQLGTMAVINEYL